MKCGESDKGTGASCVTTAVDIGSSLPDPVRRAAKHVDEGEWLTDVCCDVAERAASSDDTYSRSPVERLSELCEFLQYAREIGVPPSVGRGDQ